MNFGLTQRAFTEMMIFILLVEHIFSYCSGIFKDWELKTRGEVNEKGIETAKIGSILYWVEIVVDIIIIILIVIHLGQMDSQTMHDLPLLNYWILFDTVIMFLTLPYMALAKILILKGEITKNIFTLYQVQKKKLKNRRKSLSDVKPKDHQKMFKKFFQEQKEIEEEEEKQVKPSMRFKSMEQVIGDRSNYKRKKTKKNTAYADEINAENRQREEEDDETSQSSDDSTPSSEEDLRKLKQKSRLPVIVKEADFELNETLTFTNDVYNYTICANMTKCCSPLQQGFALKQCFIVFSVQMLVPIFFIYGSG